VLGVLVRVKELFARSHWLLCAERISQRVLIGCSARAL